MSEYMYEYHGMIMGSHVDGRSRSIGQREINFHLVAIFSADAGQGTSLARDRARSPNLVLGLLSF
jgi:hypothetical protein